MSRRAAHKAFTLEDFDRDMAGIEVRRSAALLDELPGAYKDIDAVSSSRQTSWTWCTRSGRSLNVKGD